MSVLVPMSAAYYEKFAQQAIDGYAQQNVASGRWPAESALELSRAEHEIGRASCRERVSVLV